MSPVNPMNKDRIFKSAMYESLALIGKAVASAARIELLDLLSQGPRTVENLAAEAGHSVANTSQHLQVLRRASLVSSTRSGTHVAYALAEPGVGDFVRELRELGARRIGDIDRTHSDFLKDRGAPEALDPERLRDLMAGDAITVVDVRPAPEFNAGHLAGALSIPLDELESRLSELPADRDVVVYCRGPWCVMALDAVEKLASHGYTAARIEQGVYDFRAAGFRMQQRLDVSGVELS